MLAAMILAGGCQHKPPPFAAPPLELRTEQYAGTPLAGPATRPVAAFTAREALAVRMRLVSLESMPAGFGSPLGAEARFIAATRQGAPVLPSSRLTSGARISRPADAAGEAPALPDAAGRLAEIGLARFALPAGATVAFLASEKVADLTDPVTGRAVRRGVEVSLHRPAARQLSLTLAVDDLIGPDRELTSDDDPADAPGATTRPAPPPVVPLPQRELAVLDLPMPGARLTLVLVIPIRFSSGEGSAVAAIMEVEQGSDDPEHALAVTAAMEDIRRTAGGAASRPSVSPVASSEWAGILVAASALDVPERRRASLTYLTGQTGAGFCSDVVLTADDAVLADLAATVKSAIAAQPGPLTADGAGWMLDRAAFEHLQKLMSKEILPAELRAVLTFHFGEAGRQAGSLDEIARGLRSRRDFDTKLIEENLIFLEDSSPSSRVRAYDWLNARKLAPAGYDPLGDPRERRKAIERALTPPGNAP